jgi:hypothetical protein
MTIIRPNSISGITSITAQSDTINIYKSDGTLSGLQLNGVNFNTTSGISTFSNVVVADGSASTPSLKFSSSSTTGLYSPGANQFGIATNGTARITIDSNGNVTIANTINVPLGSASAPAFSFTGDSNTGIYSPGADQVAISTNGTGRLFVDASGNVGIGTSANNVLDQISSARPLLVQSASSSTTIGGSANAITICNSDTTASNTSQINFAAISGPSPLQFSSAIISAIHGARTNGQYPTGSLVFLTSTATNSAPTEKLRITNDGKLGLGTSSPGVSFDVQAGATSDCVAIRSTLNTNAGAVGGIALYGGNSSGTSVAYGGFYGNIQSNTAGSHSGGLRFYIADSGSFSEKMRLTPTGLGIGTTSPSFKLHSYDTAAAQGFFNGWSSGGTYDAAGAIRFGNQTGYQGRVDYDPSGNTNFIFENSYSNGAISWKIYGGEKARLTPTGQLLVGTSTAFRSDSFIQVKGGNSSSVGSLALASTSNNPTSGADLGFITITDTGGNRGASIVATADGNWTSGTSQPTRLALSTTAADASSPTERMRITSDGYVYIGKTTGSTSVAGTVFLQNYAVITSTATNSGDRCLILNRQSADGDLLQFWQADTQEGAVSVSGTTVTYGGGHLARWSQLPNAEDPSTLLKGTVLSNLDEMCEWGEEDNEQLNRTKVSDVEGDPNVAGVYVSASPTDDGPLDFWLAMTGDMIIRIAEGVTVQRGDLLMSAGDGTAKPQDDDIVRSKTIAKVTSNHVTCTYDDGSYCVPCVLMAC